MAVRREQVIRTAEKYVSKGRIDAAIREYRKVLDNHPEDVNTLNRLGDLYARIQRYDEAVELFERIAEGYTDDGFFVKAIAIYKKIIKLDPTRLEIYESLAELYHKQGLINEARTQYQVLADYYNKHNNPTSAIKVYQKMAELEPDNPTHHVKLAELYVEQKLTEKAMAEYATIAALMIDHGHPGEAVQVYGKALDVEDSDIGFITDAAMKLKEAGHIAEAVRFLSLASDRNPEARRVAQLVGMEPPKAKEPEAAPEAPSAETAPTTTAAAEPGGSAESETAETAEAEALEQQAAPAGLAEEDSETDLVLDVDSSATGLQDAFDQATEAVAGEATEAEAEAEAEPAAEPAEAPAKEVELDLDEVFVLDLEDDEPSASQVQPPPDMLDGRPARAFQEPEAGEEAEVEEPDLAEEPAEARSEEATAEAATVPGAEAAPEAAAEAAAEPTAEPTEKVEVDEELLEQTVSDLQPPEAQRDDSELVSEAEVLAKYEMTDKAIERLREALSLNPQNLEAYEILIGVHLRRGNADQVSRLAARMARAAEEVGDSERWPRTRERLEDAGYRFDEATEVAGDGAAASAPVAPPPRKKKAPKDRVNRLLEELVGQVRPRRKKKRKKPAEPPPETAAPTPEPAAQEPEPPPETPPETPPEMPLETHPEAPVIEEPPLPAPDQADITLHGIFDELEPPAEQEAAAEPAAAEAAADAEVGAEAGAEADAETAAQAAGDDGTSWLDEVEKTQVTSGAADPVFKDEDDFFDLAGELEQELSEEEALGGEALIQPQEQSLEEIVAGFKQGVAENLSPEDYDTHFNLGLAYREMGLLDEAIGEFQVASKSRQHLVECCSMLGLCFLDKGLPELAVKWYRQGLATPDLTEEESLGLLYDMGNVYLASEDKEAAKKTFVEVYGINSNYRDVVAKLEEVKEA